MEAAVRRCPSCQTPIPGDQRTCPSCGAISLPGVTGGLGDDVLDRLRVALGPRYRIESEIGQGGMAVVYRAHDLRHDRPVALKVLRPQLSAYLGADRFLREIHIAAQLNHPHILALHDSGDADGLLFFVMPFVDGETLRQRVSRLGQLPLAEAVTIAGEVADGLAYAHDLGVVHRDIKPENILLSHGHAAIADFGIARAVAGSGGDITTTGVSLGTPVYMSPEQATGEKTLDHRADIYSLGCVLFEMLTGRPPYRGPTAQALLIQHSSAPVPSARAARAGVSESLDTTVRRAIAKNPDDRFQTAAAFRAALGAVPVAAGPAPGAWPRFLATRRRRAWAAAALVAALGGALLLLGRRPPPAPQPPATLEIVVQPFEDHTGRARGLASQITELLTQRLAQVRTLHVKAAAVVAQLRDASLDTLRARFKPDRVIMGQLDTVGGTLRASTQVVVASSGTALGDSSTEVPRGALAAVQVAAALSAYVRHTLWNELQRVDRRARVHGEEAWRLVVSARDRRDEASAALEMRFDGQGFRSLDVADSLLREARRQDGSSDLIPLDQADIAEKRAFYTEYLGQVVSNPPPNLPTPAAERERGIGILDRLIGRRRGPPDAYELRGRLEEGMYRELHADSLLRRALDDYHAATDLDPHNAKAWQELAGAYASAGSVDDALWAIQRAFDEDAFQLYSKELYRTRFDVALRAGRFESADEACSAGAAEAPGDIRFADCRLELWSKSRGDLRSAAAARAKADSLGPDNLYPYKHPQHELWVAEILAKAGLGDSAERVARRALAGTPAAWQPIFLLDEAYLRVLRRDSDSALALIRALLLADPGARRAIGSVPWLDPLRADPRFATVLGKR